MYSLLVSLCVFVVYFSESNSVLASPYYGCSDCISIRYCQAGRDFAEMVKTGRLPLKNRRIFYNAICGRDPYNSPKVCCSHFPKLEYSFNNPSPKVTKQAMERTERANKSGESVKRNAIENHPNLRLLQGSCGDTNDSWTRRRRITGGQVAKLYEFPWMALIIYRKSGGFSFDCAGSVINAKYILTAAHCIIEKGELKKNIHAVRIGEFDYSTKIDCEGNYIHSMFCEYKIQDIEIAEYIPHKDFSRKRPIHDDIALLRLKQPIVYGNNAAPICLPVFSTLRNANFGGKMATVAGWGSTESTKLLKVEIPILNNDTCGNYYRKYGEDTLKNSFCAGELHKDSCSGDSGGPLMVESIYDNSLRMVQVGIVSYGPTKCGDQFPGVYTDVTKYMGWILDHIKK